MENNIPTVEEFCNERLGFEEYGTDVPYFMIEFAKMHVQAALKSILENVTLSDDKWDSILNAYPLTNIK